jgi:hypothetical protein
MPHDSRAGCDGHHKIVDFGKMSFRESDGMMLSEKLVTVDRYDLGGPR